MSMTRISTQEIAFHSAVSDFHSVCLVLSFAIAIFDSSYSEYNGFIEVLILLTIQSDKHSEALPTNGPSTVQPHTVVSFCKTVTSP